MHEHEHEHEHEHKHECACGHDHAHEHEHEHECACGHDHEHEHEHGCACGHHHKHGAKAGQHTRVYKVEGLDCAGCAAKIEEKIRSLPQVTEASLSYATGQLRVTAEDPDALLPQMQAAADAVEDGVTLTPKHPGGTRTATYTVEGLDCAGCAAELEARLRKMEGVEDLQISFATRQMKLTARDPDALLPRIREAAEAMEDGITILPGKTHGKPSEEKGDSREKKDLISIAAGGVLFVAGMVLEHTGAPLPLTLCILAAAYLILGGEVLLTAWKNIRKGRVFDENFLMSIATLGAFAISEYPEAVGVMLFYRIGEYFEDRAVAQSRGQIMAAVDMRPQVVNLVLGEQVQVIAAAEARPGDLLLVRPGDRIPLDGTVVAGESRIDTSPITGEPVPVKVCSGNPVISGCVNTAGQLTIRVEKPLEESMVTRILDSVENAAANKPAIDRFIARFARVYTPVVVFAALAVALVLPFLLPSWHFFVDPAYTGPVSVFRGTTGTASVFTALTFLVISCPCALVLSVPLTFFSGIGAASRKGILFKGGNVMEALTGIKAVVMDKTGTITRGEFRVQAVIPVAESVSGEQIMARAASCEQFSTHPIAVSITSEARARGLETENPEDLQEIAGHGIRARLSTGVLLCGNRRLMEENGVDLHPDPGADFGTQVLVAENGILLGVIRISDTLKEDAAEAVSRIKAQGIVTAMLTGDAPDSAHYVAGCTGIDRVHARLLPENKLSELQNIRRDCGPVMFVGDGINDAPVLAGADVGAAMGSGADAAIEAADVVFMGSEMSAIPEAVEIARSTRRIAWQNVYFALGVKLIVMLMCLAGHANMWIAVFADTGVSMLCLLNAIRLLRRK